MNYKYLAYFLEVARQESFTKAAAELFVCQSSLSKAIKSLEQDLDTVLVDRSTREFKLTSHGHTLYEQGRHFLQTIHEEEKKIMDSLKGNQDEMRIGIPPVILTAYFPSIIHEFRKLNPLSNIYVTELGANTIKKQVDSGAIDLGVIIMPFAYQGYKVYPIASSINTLLVHKSHPLAERKEVAFRELAYEDFLILDNTYMLHDRIISNCRNSGFEPKITCQSSQWDFLAEMVSLNQGITILPLPIVMRFTSQNVKRLKLIEPEFPWDISVIIKKGKYISNIMTSFIKFAREKGKKQSFFHTELTH